MGSVPGPVVVATPGRGSGQRRSSAPSKQEAAPENADGFGEPPLLESQTIQARAAPPPAEGSPHPTRRDEKAESNGAQVEDPGGEVIGAASGELPRSDFRLTDERRVVSGGDVVQIVKRHRASSTGGIREPQG